MRVVIRLNLLSPDGQFPTVLVRTCYGRELSALEGEFWASRGYVHVAQDVRGRGDSEGHWDPFMNERQDGKDTIDWIAKQPWSDGNVGMIGASYLGFVQWQAAVEQPAALKCIVPQVSPPHPFYNIPWDNGLFLLAGNIWWSKIVQGKETDFSSLGEVPGGESLATLPLEQADDRAFGSNVPFFDSWLERDTPAEWPAATLEEVANVKIPVLAVSGTWDGDGVGTRLQWDARRNAGHQNQWLVFGPWEHAFNTSSKFGNIDYGPDALLELDSLYLRFFDTHLKGKAVQLEQQPRVRFFLSGANRWLDLPDFPGPTWQRQEWFLSAPSPSNGLTSGGLLLAAAQEDPPSRWLYNPARSTIDPEDLSTESSEVETVLEIEEPEQGVLLFKGAPFERTTLVSGSIEVELHFATSAQDASLHAFLVDEHPDGSLHLIGQPGNQRLAFNGQTIEPLPPNTIKTLTIKPWWFAQAFEPGHRLTLVVSSESFPGFARVLGGSEPDKTATKLISAHHTLFHDPSHPSKLTFWWQEL
jgi:putative CocE/NonD family hydrolase